MASDAKMRNDFGYGGKGRDASPTGSKATRGTGGTGRVVGQTVRGDMDGNAMEVGGKSRMWDTGQVKGFKGANIAPAKASGPGSHPTDSTLKNPSGKGMPGGGSYGLGPKSFPDPSTREDPTVAQRFGGIERGSGPKVKGTSTGGDVQKGRTGGTDKTPKGSKNSPGVTGGKSYRSK